MKITVNNSKNRIYYKIEIRKSPPLLGGCLRTGSVTVRLRSSVLMYFGKCFETLEPVFLEHFELLEVSVPSLEIQ